MPSTNTSSGRSSTSDCTPRIRIRDPVPVSPEPGTTSRPGTRSMSRAPTSRTAPSRVRRAASMKWEWVGRVVESVGAGVVSVCPIHVGGRATTTAPTRRRALRARTDGVLDPPCRTPCADLHRSTPALACGGAATWWVLQRVVRRLPGDHDVVGVGLPQPGARDLDELRLGPERFDVAHATVAHAAAQPTHHLEDHVGGGAPIRHAPLDALGHELGRRDLAFLEVA